MEEIAECHLSTLGFLVFALQMFDDLSISFKMDCEKQNNKSKSAVIMLRIAMWGCEKVKNHIETLYSNSTVPSRQTFPEK